MRNDQSPDLKTVWIVVPALNEATTIADVVTGLADLGYPNICVVDDGSRDATAEEATANGAHVLSHIINFGQGAALQTGISYALGKGARYVCTFDADGQHSPKSIDSLLTALLGARADVALGSRFVTKTSAVPRRRRLLLGAALLFTRFHARLNVTDTHNGLRAFTRRAAELITINQAHMAHASEILQKIGTAKLSFVEVPVEVSYSLYSRRKGQSGFDFIKILLDLLYRSIALRP
ncbi:MAG TPA: glycosyltransferase family 2 protein [Candidatus Tumulicola sp.]|jgi:glycosyltransferase involved in cell wall biosynthesis